MYKEFLSVLYFYIIWNGQVICPWCWVLLQALCCWNGLAKCCTQHNAQGRDHSMTLRYGLVDSTFIKKFLFHRDFDYYYKCLIITRRLCHRMWSRKWHNLPPQVLNVRGEAIIKGITLSKGSGPSSLCPKTKEWPLVLPFPSGIHWLKLEGRSWEKLVDL